MAAALAMALPEHTQPPLAGWQKVEDAPCRLSAEISARGFTIRDLLLLQPGFLVSSGQPTACRIALHVNGSLAAWAEFEVIEGRLGVRLTELG